MPELAYEADFRAWFTREAELAASIDHPNIVPVYEAGEADGGCSSRCDVVDGTDLRSVILREGRWIPPVRSKSSSRSRPRSTRLTGEASCTAT